MLELTVDPSTTLTKTIQPKPTANCSSSSSILAAPRLVTVRLAASASILSNLRAEHAPAPLETSAPTEDHEGREEEIEL